MSRGGVVTVALLAAGVCASAQDLVPDGAFVQGGKGDQTSSVSLGLSWDWRRTWPVGQSLLLRVRAEAAVGRWRARLDEGARDWAWVTQFSAAPTLRLSSRAREGGLYGEFGLGPTLLLPLYRSRDKTFSTRFNFQSHLAVGHAWGPGASHEIAARIDHYSNAGIREPNPGLNLLSLRYAWRFRD